MGEPYVVPAEDGIYPGWTCTITILAMGRREPVTAQALRKIVCTCRPRSRSRAASRWPPRTTPTWARRSTWPCSIRTSTRTGSAPDRANSNAYKAAEAAIRADNPFVRLLKDAHWSLGRQDPGRDVGERGCSRGLKRASPTRR